jgi:hypothetical protein
MRTSQRRCDIGLADLKAQCVGLPEEASLGLGTLGLPRFNGRVS